MVNGQSCSEVIQSMVVIAEKLGEWSIEVGLDWAILVNQGWIEDFKNGRSLVLG